jgi:RNase P/RNase MRP subunit p30
MDFSIVETIKEIKGKKRPIYLESDSYKILRHGVEKKLVDGIIHTELQGRKDSVHYRRSGIDDVLAKFMAKNKVAYVIDMEALLDSKEPDVVLGRVMQNIMLCKKFKTKISVVNADANSEILISFLETLGMDRKDAKGAI